MDADKEMLIGTMRKLIMTINNNKQQQLKIFDSLSKDDIIKIIHNFEHEDEGIRKMSARLISQLMYDNNLLKQKLCETLKIFPINGNIVLNKIPDWLKQSPRKLLEIMKFLKNDTGNTNKKQLCWYIDPLSSVISVQYVDVNSFPNDEFIDPKVMIFGMVQEVTKQPIVTTLPFKQSDYLINSSKYYIKTTPSEKPKLNFINREKNNITLDQSYNQTSKIGQLSFKTDRSNNKLEKTRLSNQVYDRSGVVTDRYIQPITSPLTYSNYRPKELETQRDKQRLGIQMTSPSSTTSNIKHHREEDRHIIVLGGKRQFDQLTTSLHNVNVSTPEPKSYTFNTKSPTVTSYNPSSGSSSLEYSKLISQLRQSKQEREKNISKGYKPSDNLLQKIKARD